MKAKARQLELRACSNAFNLFGERGIDPVAVLLERGRQAAAAEAAREFERKMQRLLSECPGFVGCCPPGAGSPGNVTVQPAAADAAMDFLKRRFHVGGVGWKKGLGLTVEVLPRRKGVTRATARRRLAPVEQFQLNLGEVAASCVLETTEGHP